MQLDDCEDLRVAVGGSNWDLLGGNVRTIEVSATKAIYKVPLWRLLFHLKWKMTKNTEN